MAPGADRHLAAILSADVVGYSRLMAEDEEGTVRRLGAYRTEITNLVGEHRGRVVDFSGDNFLAEFPTATDAVEAAAEIQRVLKARNAAVPIGRAMEFRIGVHLGEVRVEGERLFGDGVNIAARLEGLAEPGGICVSDDVIHQVQRKLELDFDDLGEQTVKNIPDPVHAYQLRERAAEALAEPSQRVRWMPLAVAVAVVLGVGAWWFLQGPTGTTSPGLITEPALGDETFTVPGFGDVPAIAVLPFDNLSGDPDQEYFADGLAEDLITRLSTWGRFPVIARNSSFTYRGKAVDVQQVGRELGARYVVEGSVRRAGDRVRISAQLIDSTTAHHVWAERYDRELRDIFAIQDEITGSIVASMGPELSRSEARRAARGHPRHLGAYDLSVRGWWHYFKSTPRDTAEARELFERATELDPSHAPAWAGLAFAHLRENEWQLTDSPERSLLEAARASRECLAQDKASPRCYQAIGLVHQRRGEQREFIAAAEQGLALAPSDAFAHGALGQALALGARSEEAIAQLQMAMRLDPKGQLAFWMDGMTWAHFAAGRYKEALDWARRSVRRNPDNEVGYRGIAASAAHLGRLEEARAAVAEELRLVPMMTVAKVRRVNASTDPGFLERWLEGLRMAGLPEE